MSELSPESMKSFLYRLKVVDQRSDLPKWIGSVKIQSAIKMERGYLIQVESDADLTTDDYRKAVSELSLLTDYPVIILKYSGDIKFVELEQIWEESPPNG